MVNVLGVDCDSDREEEEYVREEESVLREKARLGEVMKDVGES